MQDVIIAIIVLVFLVLLVLIPNIKILAPNNVMIIERLGLFHRIITKPGVYLLIPLFERVPQVVSLEPVHKKLNIKDDYKENTILLTYKVINPKLFVYAALDSEKNLMNYIKESYAENQDDTSNFEESITEYASKLGIELTSIKL